MKLTGVLMIGAFLIATDLSLAAFFAANGSWLALLPIGGICFIGYGIYVVVKRRTP